MMSTYYNFKHKLLIFFSLTPLQKNKISHAKKVSKDYLR